MMTSQEQAGVRNDLDLTEVGVPAGATTGDQLGDLTAIVALAAAEGFVAWKRYQLIYTMLGRNLAAVDGSVPDQKRLVDPLTSLACEVATALAIHQSTAERQIDLAITAHERLPRVARLLRDGVLSVRGFAEIALQTGAVVDDDVMAAIDADLAIELRVMGPAAVKDVSDTARRFVAEFDPDALRDRRKAACKGVTVATDVEDATLSICTSPEDAALAKKCIDALAARVCANDSRTVGERRADAAVARLTGAVFCCDCGRDDCAAALSDAEIAEAFARIVVHVVADASTLNEGSDKAAFLDGFGVIDAHHAREIVARSGTVVRPLDVAGLADRTARAGDPYRPTAACDTAVRALFGTCSHVGCQRPAWNCDLDHVCEYNHARPAAGGATCFCNLNPKCRFHHLVKTYGEGWLDDQIVDAEGVVWTEITTPSGYRVRRRAANHWLLPDLGLIPCRHGAPTAPGVVDPAGEPERARTRTQAKHDYRMRLRSQRRYAVACAQAAAVAVFESADEPPF
ncbi:DUF222 domain-containing protein [Gordonia sp. (in: high G+C Gram-positive bacteria)]|uniref:DUF222 domain-containing protein n=1 Tax=Gordonia sp. (in: high G+C Gram-positive bacteria) TaxID=84139 RepID=UPI003C73102E